MKIFNILILLLPTVSLSAVEDWEGWDVDEGQGVWIEQADRPIYEGEEYPIYHQQDGDYRYETILLRDPDVIETYDPERGEYNIYYQESRDQGRESYRPRR